MEQQSADFEKLAHKVIDWIIAYRQGMRNRALVSSQLEQPGQIMAALPEEMPMDNALTDDAVEDFIGKILPGIQHWQHPNFHGYFPCGSSYASAVGELLACGLGTYNATWKVSPSGSELELLMMKWLTKAFAIPAPLAGDGHDHLATMMTCSSEAILVAFCAARDRRLANDETLKADRLVAYASNLCHACVIKAAHVTNVRLRLLEPDCDESTEELKRFGLRGITVEKAIAEDIGAGLTPFFILCTLGTTDLCSFDQLCEMKELSDKYDLWIHVDAAYAGAALCCPELHAFVGNGLQYCHSLEMNPYKWLLTNHDGSCFWSNRRRDIQAAMDVDSAYFRAKPSTMDKRDYSAEIYDFKRFCIPTARFPRSIKFWFVFNYYGVNGLRRHIRLHVRLAKRFADHVEKYPHLELVLKPTLGLVCFKMAPPFTSSDTEKLLMKINKSGETFLTGTIVCEQVVIRLCLCAEHITDEDVDRTWQIVRDQTEDYIKAAANRLNGLCHSVLSQTKIAEGVLHNTEDKSSKRHITNGFRIPQE